jgi:hypothetical protein
VRQIGIVLRLIGRPQKELIALAYDGDPYQDPPRVLRHVELADLPPRRLARTCCFFSSLKTFTAGG